MHMHTDLSDFSVVSMPLSVCPVVGSFDELVAAQQALDRSTNIDVNNEDLLAEVAANVRFRKRNMKRKASSRIVELWDLLQCPPSSKLSFKLQSEVCVCVCLVYGSHHIAYGYLVSLQDIHSQWIPHFSPLMDIVRHHISFAILPSFSNSYLVSFWSAATDTPNHDLAATRHTKHKASSAPAPAPVALTAISQLEVLADGVHALNTMVLVLRLWREVCALMWGHAVTATVTVHWSIY